MTRACVLLAIGLLTGCASVPPERQIIADVAAALGGAERLAALRAFTIEATGIAPNAGQNRMPDDDLPVWRVNEYRRTTDLVNRRMRIQQVSAADQGDRVAPPFRPLRRAAHRGRGRPDHRDASIQ